MRKVLTLLAVGVMFSGLGLLKADEGGKKVTITGEGICAKCGLGEKDANNGKCMNVVIVTKDGKETKYYLTADNQYSKAAHMALGFCSAKKDATVKVKVTGTCEKKGDKLILTPTEKIVSAD
jgi:hypothetical protein